jgi:hypothetical protein
VTAYASPGSGFAGHEDREPLSEMVDRVDLVELVGKYAGAGKKVGGYWQFLCPNPGHADRHPSFQVRTDQDGTQRARCRSTCAWSGDALDLVEWLEGVDRAEAIRTLRRYLGDVDQAGARVPHPKKKTTPAAPPPPPPPLPETTYPTPEVAATVMAGYLEGRGWPADAVGLFGLEVVLDLSGRPRVRHPFTVPTPEGLEVAAWQDRATVEGGAKWLAPLGRALPIYNVAALEDDELAAVVLCEGPADTVTAALALRGMPELAAVGIAGTDAWRPAWAQFLSGLVVVIAADNDDAGHKLAARMAGDLEDYAARVEVVTPTAGHNDLTDMGKAEGLEAVGVLLRTAARVEPDPDPDPDPEEEDTEWPAPAAINRPDPLGIETDQAPPRSLFDPLGIESRTPTTVTPPGLEVVPSTATGMVHVGTPWGPEVLPPEVAAMVARMLTYCHDCKEPHHPCTPGAQWQGPMARTQWRHVTIMEVAA